MRTWMVAACILVSLITTSSDAQVVGGGGSGTTKYLLRTDTTWVTGRVVTPTYIASHLLGDSVLMSTQVANRVLLWDGTYFRFVDTSGMGGGVMTAEQILDSLNTLSSIPFDLSGNFQVYGPALFGHSGSNTAYLRFHNLENSNWLAILGPVQASNETLYVPASTVKDTFATQSYAREHGGGLDSSAWPSTDYQVGLLLPKSDISDTLDADQVISGNWTFDGTVRYSTTVEFGEQGTTQGVLKFWDGVSAYATYLFPVTQAADRNFRFPPTSNAYDTLATRQWVRDSLNIVSSFGALTDVDTSGKADGLVVEWSESAQKFVMAVDNTGGGGGVDDSAASGGILYPVYRTEVNDEMLFRGLTPGTNITMELKGDSTIQINASGETGTGFNNITTGENTSATMTVGTGAAIALNGGTIDANKLFGRTMTNLTGTGEDTVKVESGADIFDLWLQGTAGPAHITSNAGVLTFTDNADTASLASIHKGQRGFGYLRLSPDSVNVTVTGMTSTSIVQATWATDKLVYGTPRIVPRTGFFTLFSTYVESSDSIKFSYAVSKQ